MDAAKLVKVSWNFRTRTRSVSRSRELPRFTSRIPSPYSDETTRRTNQASNQADVVGALEWPEYRAWLSDSLTRPAGSIENKVPIAVVVPVFNPPVRFLESCLNSVVADGT